MEAKSIVPAQLYPRLKADRSHPIYQSDLGRHMVVPARDLEAGHQLRVQIPMLEDIQLNFVLETENDLQYVFGADCQGWDNMALITQAFKNLRDIQGELVEVLPMEGGGFQVTAKGQHDTAFLLLSNLWLKLEDKIGPHCYAAAPTHNHLFVALQDDRTAILSLQNLVRKHFFAAAHEDLLSKAIYQRWEGEWRICATAF
jgi:hypothetical protein